MQETLPSVSILIVNYNTPKLVQTLVESLTREVAGVSFEILILNNGCDQQKRVTTEDFPNQELLIEDSPDNLGFAAGANRLASKVQSDYLLFANSDCEVTSDIVTEMMHHLQQNPRCAACSPRTVYPDGTSHSTIRRFPTHKNIGRSRGAAIRLGTEEYTLEIERSLQTVKAMAATFMMITTRVFRQAGGFDEQFFMYVEDTDLCKRLHDLGYDLAFLGQLEVRHRWGASTSQHPLRMKWHHHRSVWRYFRKHYPEKTMANLWLWVKLAVNFLIMSPLALFGNKRTP